MKLATSLLCHLIAIRKFNNITINYLQTPQSSLLPDKWLFNTSQDWKVLEDNFDTVSLDKIPDNTLRALDFHFSLLDYFEKEALRFVDITDNPDLTIKPVDNGQQITDSEDEKMKK